MSPGKTIATYGPGRDRVRVRIEGDLVKVKWREAVPGERKKARRETSFANTPAGRAEAKAWAQGFVESRHAPKQPDAPLTIRNLWDRYEAAEYPHLRPSSQRLYREYWSKWERMWGRNFLVEQTTRDMVAQLRAAMEKQGYAVNTVRKTVHQVKLIYRWGQEHDLIVRNPVLLYRFKLAKDKRPISPAEYSLEEWTKIIQVMDPKKATQWRAFVGIVICGAQGVRENAALHLQWRDVDEAAGRMTWQAAWDKQGNTWSQPIREVTRFALAIAREWRERNDHRGPWVIPAGSGKNRKSETYSAQSLIAALRTAERKAGVPYIRRRGPHGFRRLLSGEVWEVTRDAMLALRAIGDRDPRQIERYLKDRDPRVQQAFEQLDQRTAVVLAGLEDGTLKPEDR